MPGRPRRWAAPAASGGAALGDSRSSEAGLQLLRFCVRVWAAAVRAGRQRDEWSDVWKGGKREAGRGGAGRRGDRLIALFGGEAFQQQQQLLEGPLLKCFHVISSCH